MTEAANLAPSVRAEYDTARTVLVHEPGAELLSALLWPEESCFARCFDSTSARREHRAFTEALSSLGVEVLRLGDLLQRSDRLREMAADTLSFPLEAPSDQERSTILDVLSSADLVRILLERPAVSVRERGSFDPELRSRALSNLYFVRDQLLTTDRGVVLGRFARPVRRPEVGVVRAALEAAGIRPLYAIEPEGVLEGGDFMAAGQWGLFGIGARSNQQAIDQLLTLPGARALGYERLAVVRDPETSRDWQQQQMHLDTYFMLVGADTCIVEASRIREPKQPITEVDGGLRPMAADRRPLVDTYRKTTCEEYVLEQADIPFLEFLQSHLEIENIIPVLLEDQYAFGCNVLCLRERMVLGSLSAEQSELQREPYLRQLALSGVECATVDFTNLRQGFGSNHCVTQVLVREVQ